MGVTAIVAAYIANTQVLLRDSLMTWLIEAFLAFAIGANAIVTFFGSLNLEAQREFSPGDADIRRAIAIAVVLMYLQLVATFAFFKNTPPFDGLLVNFTTTTGVVIAFYFGSSAFIDSKRGAARKNEKEGARAQGA